MQKRFITKAVLPTLLLLVTGSAWAGWVRVGSNEDATFYIDPTTIRMDGSLRKVWEMRDFKQRNKRGAISSRLRQEYDCRSERHKLLSISEHSEPMTGGDVLGSSQYNDNDWQEIPPATVVEFYLRMVCAK